MIENLPIMVGYARDSDHPHGRISIDDELEALLLSGKRFEISVAIRRKPTGEEEIVGMSFLPKMAVRQE